MTVFAMLLAGSPIASGIGVTHVRKGEWRDWRALTAKLAWISNVFSRPRDFASPAAALFWIECRRGGGPALGSLAVVILLVSGGAAFWGFKSECPSGQFWSDRFSALLGSAASVILAFLVFIWIPPWGLMVCADGASRRLRMSSLRATRLLASGPFIGTELKVMAALWLAGWVLALLFVVVLGLAFGGTEGVLGLFERDSQFGLFLVAVWVVSIQLLVGLFALWLTGRVPELLWSFLGLLAAYGYLGNIIAWFDRHQHFQGVVLLWVGGALALKLGIAAGAFREDLKRGRVGRGFV